VSTNNIQSSYNLASKIKDYFQLVKFTLSFTVVFTCVLCYLLAPNIVEYNWLYIIILFLAGLLITGSANAINQATEKDTDAITHSIIILSGVIGGNFFITFLFYVDCITLSYLIGFCFRSLNLAPYNTFNVISITQNNSNHFIRNIRH